MTPLLLRHSLAASALALAVCGTAPTVAAQGRAASRPSVVIIHNVTVVDVAQGTLVPNQRIVIRGDTIAAVESMTAPAPGDASQTIDGAGLFAIPGLVDHHVHLGPGMDSALVRAVRGGVTMVQAMAGDNRVAGNYARAVLAGELKGPEIAYASVMAGPDFFADPRFRSAGLGYAPGLAPWAHAVTAGTNAVMSVAGARGSGAEVLKLYAMMDAPLVARLTNEAHRQGMRVIAHGAVFPARPSELVAAGVDILTHVPYLSWEGAPELTAEDSWNRRNGPYDTFPADAPAMRTLIQQMATRGTWLEPTLWVFHRDPADSVMQQWGREVTRAAHRAGVPILAGTDGLIGGGAETLPNIHEEMALMVRAGLSPADALATATINPARVMGRGETHGLVAAGRVADLLLLEANPLADIRATRSIRHVVRRGEVVR
ncbi:MAG: amidohydrolase family protein [Gemmatimonadales bacterium]